MEPFNRAAPMTHDNATHAVTRLLDAIGAGEPDARQRLWDVVYDELRAMARAHLADENRAKGLAATTLVHEAYLRLFGSSADTAGNGRVAFSNRRHFFGAAANAMRRILVDDARHRARLKRGGRVLGPVAGGSAVEEAAMFDTDPTDLIALEEVLARFEAEHPRAAEVVHLRYFAGLSVDQTAELMGLAPRTVDSEWRMARAWLYRALSN